VREIVAAAIVPGMTDGEKAFALWFQASADLGLGKGALNQHGAHWRGESEFYN
jgi:hypothetical protein